MGNCGLASSRSHGHGQQTAWPSSTARVIDADGTVEEYEEAVPVDNVVAKRPGYYVCDGAAMEVGARPPAVAQGEQLHPGHIYFLLPVSSCRRPLSLPDLCRLAAKASAALSR